MIGLKWAEADIDASCLRLEDSKEGESIRPVGLPVVEYLERRRTVDVGTYVFPRQCEDNAFGSFPSHWKHLFEDSPLSDVTPHVLRHSFASIANDRSYRGDHRGLFSSSLNVTQLFKVTTSVGARSDTRRLAFFNSVSSDRATGSPATWADRAIRSSWQKSFSHTRRSEVMSIVDIGVSVLSKTFPGLYKDCCFRADVSAGLS